MLELIWPALVVVAICAVLGWSLALAVGLRGLWAAAVAPAFACTVIGIATVIAGWLGVPWSALPALLTAAVIGGGILLARRLLGSHAVARFPGDARWWTLGTLVVVGAVLAVLVLRTQGAPDAISQSFDNIFHLNAIRYILDEGAASPLEIGQMTSPGGGLPFYPSAWHAMAALVVQLSGVGIPTAVNAQTLVIAAVVWPMAAVLLTRVLVGAGASAVVGAGIIAAAVPAFPLLPMDYGVLYPYQLSLALLPVALAATAGMLSVGTAASQLAPGWWALVLAGILPGLALAHPGGFVGWVALSVPLFAAFALRLWRTHPRAIARVWIALGAVAYAVIGVLLLRALRPPLPTRQWPLETGMGDALWRAISVTLFYPDPAWLAGIAVLAGIVWAFRERRRESFVAAGMWLIGATLFIAAIALRLPTLRDALTGSWYNNWPRLAALFAIALLPLAALGISRTVDAVGEALRRRGTADRTRLVLAVAAAVAAVLAFHLQATPTALSWAGRTYDVRHPQLLSDDERALLDRLDAHVPADAVVAGNPYTGAALAYALADRQVLMPHALTEVSDEMDLVNDHLADAAEMPEVCAAIEDLDVGFVLDFGDKEVHPGETHPLRGLRHLDDSPAVRLVDHEGEAGLYQVVACDPR